MAASGVCYSISLAPQSIWPYSLRQRGMPRVWRQPSADMHPIGAASRLCEDSPCVTPTIGSPDSSSAYCNVHPLSAVVSKLHADPVGTSTPSPVPAVRATPSQTTAANIAAVTAAAAPLLPADTLHVPGTSSKRVRDEGEPLSHLLRAAEDAAWGDLAEAKRRRQQKGPLLAPVNGDEGGATHKQVEGGGLQARRHQRLQKERQLSQEQEDQGAAVALPAGMPAHARPETRHLSPVPSPLPTSKGSTMADRDGTLDTPTSPMAGVAASGLARRYSHVPDALHRPAPWGEDWAWDRDPEDDNYTPPSQRDTSVDARFPWPCAAKQDVEIATRQRGGVEDSGCMQTRLGARRQLMLEEAGWLAQGVEGSRVPVVVHAEQPQEQAPEQEDEEGWATAMDADVMIGLRSLRLLSDVAGQMTAAAIELGPAPAMEQAPSMPVERTPVLVLAPEGSSASSPCLASGPAITLSLLARVVHRLRPNATRRRQGGADRRAQVAGRRSAQEAPAQGHCANAGIRGHVR
eukprot:jgi/Mesvir1/17206/Mv07623-RA.1